MEFREIDKYNYWDCIGLTVKDNQTDYVVDNKQSLVEAAYEDNIYILGIYKEEIMVGFLMYDYDDIASEWSICRFMVGKQFQGRGYGKKAVLEFFDYFKRKHNVDKIYTKVSLDNSIACKMYADLGFVDMDKLEYKVLNKMYMVKEL